MKTLFIGGIKSGKYFNAEKSILTNTNKKPICLVTTEFFDDEIRDKVFHHKKTRGDNFITLEEPLSLLCSFKVNKQSCFNRMCLNVDK